MFFNKQKKFNNKVKELLPVFEYEFLKENETNYTDALEFAWQNKQNEFEAALFIAYLTLIPLVEIKPTAAEKLYKRICFLQDGWVSNNVVRKSFAKELSDKLAQLGIMDSPPLGNTFEFTPNMPHIMHRAPSRAFASNDYLLLAIEDVPTISEGHSGIPMPIRYRFVMAVIHNHTKKPCMFVTLETGWSKDVYLCTFDEQGNHHNLGDGMPFTKQELFLKKAMELISASLSIDVSTISEVMD